ncbi:alpha/beta hydrolase [Streptomyces sp. NPDC003697]
MTEVHQSHVPTADGGVPVRVYVPAGARPGALLYFHGGGWVIGTLDTYDGVARSLANRCGMAVVAVDYRLAPEHPYPAALDDCLAVAMAIEAGALGPTLSPGPLVVAGDSAGGNLAAALAIRARDRHGPRVDAQVLVYPITDATMSCASYRESGEGFFLTAAEMAWYWEMYLGERRGTVDPGFSPLHADVLAGLPPALVITAEYDPLRDEGEAYARRLADAGVEVRLRRFDGLIHGFFRATAVFDGAQEALDEVAEFVRARTPVAPA